MYDTALGKEIEKRVAVRVNSTDMVLYIERTGLQSGEMEGANSVWCQTPLLYLEATLWTHKVPL